MKLETYHDFMDYLQSQVVAVVSSVSADGKPQSATVFYHVDGIGDYPKFSLYFVTRRHTRKYENIAKNPAVSITVGTSMQPFSVQIEGDAEVVETGDSLEALAKFGAKIMTKLDLGSLYVGAYFPHNPFGKLKGLDFAVVRVTPRWVRYMHPDDKAKEMVYTQIMP